MKAVYTAGKYTLFFLIYSLLGAIGETLVRLILDHQLYGIHGFLNLPLFPIYGLGALLIIQLLGSKVRHPVPLFVVGSFLATALEFVGHWLIEVIFGDRIWDYSNVPLSLFGRVSLYSSIIFGFAAILLVHLVHPLVEKVVNRLPNRITVLIASVATAVLLVDIVYSVVERLTN